jgi:hypothetical protein
MSKTQLNMFLVAVGASITASIVVKKFGIA